jgi:hypothetical protein
LPSRTASLAARTTASRNNSALRGSSAMCCSVEEAPPTFQAPLLH